MFAKTRSTDTKNMFWPVSRKDVLFPALLQGKKVSFQFALSHPAFHLILLERTFLLNFGQATLFQNLLSEKNLFLCFCNQTTLLMLPKKCCGSLATKLGCFEPHVTKNSVFQFCV